KLFVCSILDQEERASRSSWAKCSPKRAFGIACRIDRKVKRLMVPFDGASGHSYWKQNGGLTHCPRQRFMPSREKLTASLQKLSAFSCRCPVTPRTVRKLFRTART